MTNVIYHRSDAGPDLDPATVFSMPRAEAYAAQPSRSAPASNDALADYLVSGYWRENNIQPHKFDTTASNEITVDISGLTAGGRQFARWAFEAWENVADVDFVEVSSGAQIIVDDEQSGAFAYTRYVDGVTRSATVNISTSYIDNRGPAIDSFSLSVFLHEIGHALGLGHQGNYNLSGTYGVDETFQNDSWQVSVMSYFSQTTNTSINASYANTVTPMMADIIAIQSMYGAPGAASAMAGNTVYGANSNIGGYLGRLFSAMNGGETAGIYHGENVAMTIYDRNGNDTIDLSNNTTNDRLDLRPETFSDTGGLIGNLGIARGTVIENAVGGSGNDTFTGNGANNNLSGNQGDDRLYGRGGDDRLEGGAGDDRIRGNNGNDRIFGGEGSDVLFGGSGNDRIFGDSVFERAGADLLFGGAGSDVLSGGGNDDYLSGGTGNDTLFGGDGSDRLNGGEGDDTLYGSTGEDRLKGKDGDDTLNGGEGADVLWGDAGADILTGDTGNDLLYGGRDNDLLIGGAGDDRLRGNRGEDELNGDAGNDNLKGGGGNDSLLGGAGNDFLFGENGADTLDGGAGNDKLYGGADNAVDTFVFAAGYGEDRVRQFEDGYDLIDLTSYGFADAAEALSYAIQTGWGAVKFALSAATGGQAGDVLFIENMTLGVNFTETDLLV